tara:strand:+ start:427 stop:660 length:234 start_codon:yes stop_codon:yes gene_type:complete
MEVNNIYKELFEYNEDLLKNKKPYKILFKEMIEQIKSEQKKERKVFTMHLSDEEKNLSIYKLVNRLMNFIVEEEEED